jgi:ABC-2 type transport system permease protein
LALPTTYAFDAMRGLVDGRGLDWTQLGIGAGSAFLLAILALVYLTKMLALFRKRGYISRYS